MRLGWACLALLSAVLFVPSPAAAGVEGMHFAPCTEGKAKLPARCGTVTVDEHRGEKNGRRISLAAVVIPASHPTHRAIAFIAGGPGEATIPLAALIADGEFAPELLALRDRYDLLFVDDRGTGASNPSRCEFAPPAQPAKWFAQQWPDDVLTACRAKLAARGDLNAYRTDAAVDDLNDVRAALGYPKLVLEGGSYGTMFSLVYMRRHPSTVTSAVLNGVTAPHFMVLPGSPDGAQAALDDLFVKCSRDRVCRANFPAFRAHFVAVARRFAHGSVRVPYTDPQTKHVTFVALSRAVFTDQLRSTLYDPEGASFVPYVIEHAYHGDYAPLALLVRIDVQGTADAIDLAANLSYACADWMPFLDARAVQAAAATSFAGDLRIRAERHACALWRVRPSVARFNAIVRSAIPTLMISGSDDPATPPKYGERELPYLPNAREVLVRGAGHAASLPCTSALIERFIRADSAAGLDVNSCSAAFTAPAFKTALPKF